MDPEVQKKRQFYTQIHKRHNNNAAPNTTAMLPRTACAPIDTARGRGLGRHWSQPETKGTPCRSSTLHTRFTHAGCLSVSADGPSIGDENHCNQRVNGCSLDYPDLPSLRIRFAFRTRYYRGGPSHPPIHPCVFQSSHSRCPMSRATRRATLRCLPYRPNFS